MVLALKFPIFQNPSFFCAHSVKHRILVIHGLLSMCVSANEKLIGYRQMCTNLDA